MHLAGKSHAGNLVGPHAGTIQRLGHSNAARAPPVFRPANLGRSEGCVFLRRRSNNTALFVENQDARSTGSNINADSKNGSLLYFDRRFERE
jgi:hypothetical protein